MAAENTIKTVVFCVTFLCAFIGFVALIPSGFFVTTKDYVQYEIPDYFTPQDIATIDYFLNHTVNLGVDEWYDFTADVNFKFIVSLADSWLPPRREFMIHHVVSEWPFLAYHTMLMCNDLQIGELDFLLEHWDAELNASVLTPVTCSHITAKAWVCDTDHIRNDLTAAWNAGALDVGFGFGYSTNETKLSSWDIVGQLLTFQSPEIFGASGDTALALNLMIGIPFWAAVAVSIYLLIMEAIPF